MNMPEIELTIGACAKIVRKHRDVIDSAMKDGSLSFTRDHDGHRVTTWDALIAWMRLTQAASFDAA